jgi:hypothetical protein
MRIGPLSQADGTTPDVRGAKTGEQVVAQAHGKYYEATHRGNLYAAGTAAGGVAPGTAVGTAAGAALYNPANSGKRLAIKKVTACYQSGTLGAGLIWHCLNTNPAAAAVTGTAVTAQNLDSTQGNNNVGLFKTAATLPATATQLYPFAQLGAALASSVAFGSTVYEDIDGAIVVEPGTSYSLQAEAAAGTSPKVSYGIVWEEIAIV